ncbi:MAG TPA: hypothetical protein VEC16_03235 [Alphaproteobacteria bacterium]|nr:hypothetical protein [Alphaproteobacteria bacterium]
MPEQDMQMNPGMDQQMPGPQDNAQQDNQEAGGNEFAQISGMISDLDRRLRVLEERYSNLRKKMQLTDQNLIDSEKGFHKEVRVFNEEILDLKRNISDFDEKVTIFGNEMGNVANKTELKVIEKYLAMWNPTMFVTRKELRQYLENNRMKIVKDEE